MEHKHVSCIVTSAGGIEEDFIKCLGDTYMASFSDVGEDLRRRGLNRIGNMVVPNANYCAFEDWVVPILDKMLEEQEATKDSDDPVKWTPSKVIHRLGKEINDERSVYYWAYKNNIPVFCPALTDGSLGDMLYFHTFKASPQALTIDIVQDIRAINTISVRAKRAGMIILGGGVVKHHIANACLMRNGAEHAVYINTGQEYDGSDAGARPDEAVSWGKIKIGADHVKVRLVRRTLLISVEPGMLTNCRFTPRPRRVSPSSSPILLRRTGKRRPERPVYRSASGMRGLPRKCMVEDVDSIQEFYQKIGGSLKIFMQHGIRCSNTKDIYALLFQES